MGSFSSRAQMLLEPSACVEMAECAPPVYLCADCVDAVRHSRPDLLLFELTLPARDVQLYCERKVRCDRSDTLRGLNASPLINTYTILVHVYLYADVVLFFAPLLLLFFAH